MIKNNSSIPSSIRDAVSGIKSNDKEATETVLFRKSPSEKDWERKALAGRHRRNEGLSNSLTWALIFLVFVLLLMLTVLISSWTWGLIYPVDCWPHLQGERLKQLPNIIMGVGAGFFTNNLLPILKNKIDNG